MTIIKTLKQSIATMLTTTVLASSLQAGEPLVLNDKEPIAKEPLFTPTLDSRIRYSFADQEGLRSSHNGSIRNRLGLLTKEIGGFQFFAEYEGTLPVDESSFFVPFTSGEPGRTVIADPRSHELNELWLNYNFQDTLNVRVGRQALNLDNQRYIGTVGWRQNEQTLDAVSLKFTPSKDLEASYTYFNQVNRIFGSETFGNGTSDFEGDSHLVNVKLKSLPVGTLTLFAYSLDLNNVIGGGSNASNNSFGASLAGKLGESDLSYYLEYGYQTDAYDSNLDYEAHYGHGAFTFPLVGKIKATAGLEYLGSDNNVGYQTPLATLHKFNGWADVFLNTPSDGLTDAYFKVASPLPLGFNGAAAYHHFEDDGFNQTFGNEFDVVLKKKLTDNVLFLTKGAFFYGGNRPDITRLTAELNIKY